MVCSSENVRAADEAGRPAEARKWMQRIERVLPEGWTVTHQDELLLVERNKPVTLTNLINAPAIPDATDRGELDSTTQTFRIRLKFAPRLSQDDYDKLAAENIATSAKVEQLRKSIEDIDHKFTQYVPATIEQKRRVAEYNSSVLKLPWHDLPDCYTTEQSIFYDSGWPEFLSFADPSISEECAGVEAALLRLFGVYNLEVAKGTVFPHWSDDSRAQDASRGVVELINELKIR
jgi:hypothetical protein